DRLILATGSRPYVPPVEGAGQEGIFLFRTVDDCRAIARYAAGCRTAVVIGGGLLGLEAARGLLTHGPEVTVVAVASHLMVQQLVGGRSAAVRRTIVAMGLNVRLEKSTQALLGDGRVTGLRFQDGETLETDMVVISCGIRSNAELARECGLPVERAIL